MDSLDHESDDQLVNQARVEGGGDTRPFEELIRRHQGFVVANCRVITRSAADAEDLAQEVFVKAFFGLRRFEGRAQFRTWLKRIKVNHCLNHLRRIQGTVMIDIEDAGEGHRAMHTPPSAHAALQAAAEHDRLMSVLDAMSDTLRIPLMLRDGDGLSYEDIAAELGLGLSAVKMRIKRAREDFRRRFADAAREPGA
ncbi:MAG TPA: sigma-70 family RNA polymerase sigma factor [Vicinamibacterales bacterium]|nr:sigma-70 family RNA polymerase sigma factor [Vicinamibacterales bacterium]